MIKHPPPRPPLQLSARPDAASLVQGVAALTWIPQAALLAMAVQGLASGQGIAAVQWPACGILLLGVLRAVCEAWGARRIFGHARAQLSALRAQTARALAAGSPLDRERAESGRTASVLAEQAEALVPYLVRYRPARWRATVVPIVILVAVASLSWVAALVLLVAAPLIPLFMAIVGWRAKAASEAQMVEMGGMNAFLLDRLRGLATLRALDAVDAAAGRLAQAAEALRARTMAVLRIAFLSSAVLELFSALGVAMVAAYVGFHLLGSLGFGAWGSQLSLGEGLFILLLAPAFFEPLRELGGVARPRGWGGGTAGARRAAKARIAAARGAGAGRTCRHRRGPHGLRARHRGPRPAFRLAGRGAQGLRWLGPAHRGRRARGAHRCERRGQDRAAVIAGGAAAGRARRHLDWRRDAVRSHHGCAAPAHRLDGAEAACVRGLGRVQRRTRARGRGRPAGCGGDALRLLETVAQAHPGVALGEGGIGLSGGEAVRLALARIAVHPHADLLLVDEPTAHLDTETAAQVADALLALARGKTLVVATHDPVLAARMNRSIRLDAEPADAALERAA